MGNWCVDSRVLDLLLYPRRKGPRWVCPRTGLDNVEKRNNSSFAGLELRSLNHLALSQSLYQLSYTGSALFFINVYNMYNISASPGFSIEYYTLSHLVLLQICFLLYSSFVHTASKGPEQRRLQRHCVITLKLARGCRDRNDSLRTPLRFCAL
jgi:hypothetical protein